MADGAGTQLLSIIRVDALQSNSANSTSLSRKNPENGGFSRVLNEQAGASSRAVDARRGAETPATGGKSLPDQRPTSSAASQSAGNDRSSIADAGRANTGAAVASSRTDGDTAQDSAASAESETSGLLPGVDARESATVLAEGLARAEAAAAAIGQASDLDPAVAVGEGATENLATNLAANLATNLATKDATAAGQADADPASGALTAGAGLGLGASGTARGNRGDGALLGNPEAAHGAKLLGARSSDASAAGPQGLLARPDLQAEALDRSFEFAALPGRGDTLRAGTRDPLAMLGEGVANPPLSAAARPGDLATSVQLPGNPLASATIASPAGTSVLGASGWVDGGLAHTPADPEFAGELTARMKMMLREGVQEARLQLNPAELGRLQVTITTDGDQARVMFVAENAAARDAIEQSLPRLRDMLEQAGLQLAQSDVDQRGFGEQPGSDAQDTTDQPTAERLATQDGDASGVDARNFLLTSNTRIDTYI